MSCSPAGSEKPKERSSKMYVPEFPDGLEWLNVDKPLKLTDLQGKIVMLDFWTYCCINCMHVIPDLKQLEEEFKDELVVIGVHSAKFTQEKGTENIHKAILRYEIEHPVVNDSQFIIWQSFGIRAWPSIVLIDPYGHLTMSSSGEGVYDRYAELIRQMVKEYGDQIDRTPIPLALEREKDQAQTDSYLSFPGKVLVDGESERLFVSDQNNNRIVICRLEDGEVISSIGSGRYGYVDGYFESAQFKHPQGMELVGDKLYIADTENHAVRVADLKSRTVTTVAGNGSQAGWRSGEPGWGQEVQLASPWDVKHKDGQLYIAMAGSHQIWSIRLEDGWTAPFAGTSSEGLLDGLRKRASLAQPSGLSIIGDKLYFTDSEVSAIRFVELYPEDGRVGTVVGLDLFEFGDVDGIGDKVRLQHPLGVTSDGNLLYIADTYNSKIKTIDPKTRLTTTLSGGSEQGYQDGKGESSRFYEPGGLDYHDGKLYVADTDNNAIRVIDILTREVTTLNVHEKSAATSHGDIDVTLEMQSVKPGRGSIQLTIDLPVNTKFNPGSDVILTLKNGGSIAKPKEGDVVSIPAEFGKQFTIPIEWTVGSDDVILEVDWLYCSMDNIGLCWRAHKRVKIPVQVTESSDINTINFNIGK